MGAERNSIKPGRSVNKETPADLGEDCIQLVRLQVGRAIAKTGNIGIRTEDKCKEMDTRQL